MRLQHLIEAIEEIAPLRGAESWDRVGLHVGSRSHELSGPVLLTIDLTERVLREAVGMGCSAVIAYHPPIWDPMVRLTDETPRERIVRGAIEAGLAIYSPHTALDAAPGGMTEWVCEGLSAPVGEAVEGEVRGDLRALEPLARNAPTREVKLVTFVPGDSLDKVRSALGTAGAGGIGRYRLCSFASAGTGTFLPEDGAHPTIGEVGKLERVEEYRLEMVCSRAQLPLAIETLRGFHPYEEPAFDVFDLAPEPERRVGAGRRLVLDQPATAGELAARLKEHLGTRRVRVGTPWDEQGRLVKTIGVVCGAGESMLEVAKREGCELFVTGELKYHSVLATLHAGVGVMLAGHTNTERGYLPRLARRLGQRLPGLELRVSEEDKDLLHLA
ncbi:MAG: Nif3-like dinuclear metal center hexameric protein [Phycisphaerales bacterium JB040]